MSEYQFNTTSWRKFTDVPGERYEELKAERDELREVIEMVEWGDPYNTERCIWCHGVRDDYPYLNDENERGHREDCPRQKALGL